MLAFAGAVQLFCSFLPPTSPVTKDSRNLFTLEEVPKKVGCKSFLPVMPTRFCAFGSDFFFFIIRPFSLLSLLSV